MDNDDFCISARDGDLQYVKELIQDLRVDPSVKDNRAICVSAQHGHVEVVRLLLKDSRVDPSTRYNYAICWAAARGHVEVVKLLLKDSRVDPSAHNNYNFAIINACKNNDLDMVKVLLSDSRVQSSLTNNKCKLLFEFKWKCSYKIISFFILFFLGTLFGEDFKFMMIGRSTNEEKEKFYFDLKDRQLRIKISLINLFENILFRDIIEHSIIPFLQYEIK